MALVLPTGFVSFNNRLEIPLSPGLSGKEIACSRL